jgi:hypothetical protein
MHVTSVADPGCLFRIRNPKKWFLSSQKYDPGFSTRIRIMGPDPDFLPIPDPGSSGQKGTGSQTRIRNIAYDPL